MTLEKPPDRERWNAKFLAGEAQGVKPDPLVVATVSGLTPGRALDLAGGAGRHALWLAEHGWDVTLADVSDEGLAIATRRASDSGLRLTIRRESAEETLAWGAGQPFDLVVIVWCLLREQFAMLPPALAPGGTLLYKTYTSDHARYTQGHSPRTALHPGELAAAFPTLKTMFYRETDGVAELVAQAG